MERIISESSYFDLYGEMPYTTYHTIVEKGFIWRYFEKYSHEDFADMIMLLVNYFKAHGMEGYILDLSDIDFNEQFNEYEKFTKKQKKKQQTK